MSGNYPRLPIYISFFLLVVLIYHSSCKSESSKKPFVIGFSQSGEADAWRKTMLDEMKRELFLHPNLKMIYRETPDKADIQIRQVDELLKEGVDVLIISATDANQLTPIVEKVYQSGIPVIIVDRNIASRQFTNHIGADNKEIGAIAAKYIANILGQKGHILEITGSQSSSPAIDRARGFDSILADYPALSLTGTIDGDWMQDKAEEQLGKTDIDLSRIDAVYTHNDVMARAAYNIFHNKHHKKIPIIGVDALPGPGLGLDMIRKGILTGSIIYPTGGKEAIRNAALLARQEQLPKQTILKTALVDSSNVQTMEMQIDKILSQQADIEQQQGMITAQQKIYRSQRTFILVLVVFLTLLLATAILLWYSRRQNRKINRALYLKNRDISSKNEQIKQMSLQAQEANEAKINFFTKISHEFRTPLSLIITPLEELLDNPKLNKDTQSVLSIMKKNAYSLLQLVSQLMDLRKVEFGKIHLQVSEEDILSFTQGILRSFDSLAKQRHISTQVVSSRRALVCFFDAYILEKILLNLLSNAFKFTPDGGNIHIMVQDDTQQNKVLFSVEDTGSGMDAASREQLFSFFHTARQNGGNGIGLHLVKELIQLHHGDVTIESQSNKGTKVIFSIPLQYAYQPEEMFLKTDQAISKETYARLFTAPLEPTLPMAPLSGLSILNETKKHTLLVIEDNEDLLQLLQNKLSATYDVVTAANGTAGIQLVYDLLPDLIICDIMLPDLSGLEITQRLKSDIKTSYIPVLLLTARSSDQQQVEGIKTLANAYLTKPFQFGILSQTIDNLLENNRILREHYTSIGTARTPQEPLGETRSENSIKSNRKFITDFASVIEQNIANEELNVQLICERLHISKVQLYRKVKALLNTSVNEYILNARITKAKYYLQEGELSISEIATKTGFNSASYFSTAFKKMTGVPPTYFATK